MRLSLCLLLFVAISAESGEIRGTIADASSAAIHNADIRVVPMEISRTPRKTSTGPDGAFRLDGLGAGRYTLTAGAAGFVRRILEIELTSPEGRGDLGMVVLQLERCEGPQFICCLDVSTGNLRARDPVRSHGKTTLPAQCALDLDGGRVFCKGERKADLLLRPEADGRVTVVAVNGAVAGDLYSGDGLSCSEASLTANPVRLDSFGPNRELCVRTNKGKYSRVWILDDVEVAAQKIEIYFVTRDRQ